jgi:hypothetical protein
MTLMYPEVFQDFGLQAGYGVVFFVGTLIFPILLWIGTIYFYGKYRRKGIINLAD